MFQELQASGLLLCYGPLALTILGFIGLAYLTDNMSTSKYLRSPDTRPDEEVDELQTYYVTQPTRVSTPSGGSVMLLPDDKDQ